MEEKLNQLFEELEKKGIYKKDFNQSQMKQIRLGLKHGLTPERVAIYADKKYEWRQMREIREGLEDGLTPEEALFMEKKLNQLFEELEKKGIHRKDFNWNQMYEIRLGLEHDLTPEQVALFADNKYDDDQMSEIRKGLEQLPPEQVAIYADEKYNSDQMYGIRKGLENDLTPEQIALVVGDKKYNDWEMGELCDGLGHANKCLNLVPEKKDFLAIISQKKLCNLAPADEDWLPVPFYDSIFNDKQLEEIGKCVNQGIPYDIVIEKIADSNISAEEMAERREKLDEELYKLGKEGLLEKYGITPEKENSKIEKSEIEKDESVLDVSEEISL